MNVLDRGYTNLLGHLLRSRLTLPLETIQAAISYYLVNLPPPHSSPTPLTASVLSSQVWHPLSLTTACGPASAFRHALQRKYDDLKTTPRGFFSGSPARNLDDWVKAVLRGLENGDAVLRLAIAGGLLLGLENIKSPSLQRARHTVEEELVIAFAECMNAKSSLPQSADDQGWEKEFQPEVEVRNGRLSLALLLASQYFPFVSENVINVLRLPTLADICLSTIQSTFQHGQFVNYLKRSPAKDGPGQVVIGTPFFIANLKQLVSSHEFKLVGPLCKLLCQTISISSNDTSHTRRRETWEMLSSLTSSLEDLTANVEREWAESLLAGVRDEGEIAPESRDIATQLWTFLKTLLFSTVMLAQAVLSTTLFLPPVASSSSQRAPDTAVELSSSVLKTLSHLSFIISKFGGVTVTSQSEDGDGRGFKELKSVFYTALDIISGDQLRSEDFLRIIVNSAMRVDVLDLGHPFWSAKKAYALACAEQLVPALSDSCIESDVLPMLCLCYHSTGIFGCPQLSFLDIVRHLRDPLHRETFESAHSVVLAIFAAHANAKFEDAQPVEIIDRGEGKETWALKGELARRLVPGYVNSLLDNSKEGKLSTPQLRLAYASLVRSATVGGVAGGNRGEEDSDEALAWLCIDELLNAIASSRDQDGPRTERLRLRLTLISLVPNVSLVLLPRLLREVEMLIEAEEGEGQGALVDALFEEILQRVGDKEKEYAMRWWLDHSKYWRFSSRSAVL